MDIDDRKIDETVLALLYLTLHDGRAWKGFDFEVMSRLHQKGFIEDPVNKNKSVVLTEEGIAESRRLFELLFAKKPVSLCKLLGVELCTLFGTADPPGPGTGSRR
jgi:hypothetical protein